MANINYILNIPAANNNPSNDQPNMEINTNAVQTILAQDHFGFGVPNGGWHQQSTYVDSGLALGTPPTIASGQAAVYSKVNGQSQLMATSDTGGNEYQLSRFIDTAFALFATDTQYPQTPAVAFELGGWTYLPGNLLLQYGSSLPGTISPSSGNTKFPISFTDIPFCVMLSPTSKSGGTSQIHTVSLQSGTLTKSQFGWNWDSSTSSYIGFYWIAIGV